MKTDKAMQPQPDKLFREKLEQHGILAPEHIWSRIEKEIPVRQRTFFTWKIAAALLLLMVSVALLIPSVTTTPDSSLLSEKSTLERVLPTQKNQVADHSTTPSATKEKHELPKKNSIEPVQKKSGASILPSKETSVELLAITTPDEEPQNLTVIDLNEQAIEANAEHSIPLTAEVPTALEEPSTSIVLAAAEVNQKYLLTTKTAQATSDTENTSSFRKLIDKATSFKNNSSGLAELRQKKNEMLALNTEKLRNRNEKNERNN